MQLDERYIAKIDLPLRDALADAPDGTILRAIMVLGTDTESERRDERLPQPSQYSSRVAWRQALIEERQHQLVREIGRTIDALRELCLKPRGGTTGHTVVVEGSAQQLLRSLDLPGVQHVSLDQPIALIDAHR